MIIYSKTGEVILDIEVDDTSYRYRAIRQGDKVYLYFSLTDHIEIPIYSYINFQGQRYTLWKPENLTKNGERNLDYIVEFGGYWELLNRTKYKFLSGKPHKLKFPLTGTPRMFMQLLIDNLNFHDTGWKLGTCIDASEKTLTFSHETCMAVLNRFADEYNTEFEFISKTINFGKVERFKDDPLPLSYGKGNGFKTGVIRQSQGEKAPITILYVQGGERNIDYSTYGSTSLLLPKSQELEYQGRRYKTDPDGMYITRADRPLIDFNEDGYDASNIYPSRVGSISEVVTVDVSKNFYDIKDSSIPNALDYSKCRIAGEKATIIFQSGILAGREFDLEQTDNALTGYVHSDRRFKIVPIEQDGTIMPNETFKPAVGDKYAIFNISLPQAYVCDNASQTGASWDMFKEAVRYMYENEEESFTFKGDMDSVWSKKKWSDIAAKLEPGSYIQFSDTQFQPEGILIRITGIKDYINKPFAPEIELSNTPVAGYLSSELGKIDSNEVKDEDRYNNSIFYTKRSWKDVKETQKMMFDPDGSFKQEYTAALLAEFGHLVIGMKSQQMDLIGVKFIPNADNNANSFKSTAGKLVHFTIKDTPTEWTIPASSHSLSSSLYYYVYAKCSRTGSTGSIYVTNQQIKFDSDSSYYYFWIGTLNTPEDNVRSWLPLYGYTEIAGQTITTGVIKDKLSRLIVDLVNARITATNGATIQGVIKFLSGSSGLYNTAEWPSISGDIDDAYGMGYNAFEKAKTAQNNATDAYNKATEAEKAAAQKAAEAERTVKNNLAYQLGFKDYAAMVSAGRLSNVLIDGGVISAAVLDAAAIVAKGISAEIIESLKIKTGNLTVTSGAKIADFVVDESQLKYVGGNFGSTAKLYIGNVGSGNPDTGGVRITALGIDSSYYVSNSAALTQDIKNMFIDNISTSRKKTSMLIKTNGGAKNTAMALFGNVAVTGDITCLGIPVQNTLPDTSIGFDHNNCLITSAKSLTLPTGEQLRKWFGENPNAWANYGSLLSGNLDGSAYDLYVFVAQWHPSNCTIYGNPGGNEDYSGINGTPLYGAGVNRTGYGHVTLQPGHGAHFKKIGRQWFCIGVN